MTVIKSIVEIGDTGLTTVTKRSKPQFAWSYSKLKNYETCPKRYYAIDVAKQYKEDDDSGALKYGNTVHKVLADRINSERVPLPKGFEHLEPWAQKVLKGADQPGVKLLVEQQLAITQELGPAAWFGRDVWYRGVADVIKIIGPVGLVIDWKTGKILEDGVQLALMAQCVFAHHPEVERLRTEFIWLKEDATTRADFSRADMAPVWAGLLPRVTTLKNAHDAMDFPPKPGGLCKRWCVVENCPHRGT